MTEYPDNPCVDPTYTFKVGAIAALKKFKAVKTFEKTTEERFEAMKVLIDDLVEVYGVKPVTLEMEGIDGSFSGGSSFNRLTRVITMRGKLSIITVLHEFGHARDLNEFGATKFSVNLFKRVYPKQFNKLMANGHALTLPETSTGN